MLRLATIETQTLCGGVRTPTNDRRRDAGQETASSHRHLFESAGLRDSEVRPVDAGHNGSHRHRRRSWYGCVHVAGTDSRWRAKSLVGHLGARSDCLRDAGKHTAVCASELPGLVSPLAAGHVGAPDRWTAGTPTALASLFDLAFSLEPAERPSGAHEFMGSLEQAFGRWQPFQTTA
jgi:hypothetical protein